MGGPAEAEEFVKGGEIVMAGCKGTKKGGKKMGGKKGK
jgi:hypothetical protein